MKKEEEQGLLLAGLALLLWLMKNFGLPFLAVPGGGGKKDKDEPDQPHQPGEPEPTPGVDTTPIPAPTPEPEPSPIYTDEPVYIPTPSYTPQPDYVPSTPPPVMVTPDKPAPQPVYTLPHPAPIGIPLPRHDYTTTPVELIHTTVPYYTLINSGISVTPEIIAQSEAAALGVIGVAETSAVLGVGVGVAAGVAVAAPVAGLIGAAALAGAAGVAGASPTKKKSRGISTTVTTPTVNKAIQTGSTGHQQSIVKSLFG